MKHYKVERAVVGQLNTASRVTVNKKYFELMHNAQIIVTVNPSDWEGDFRLWESMATGALIFVDPIFAPHPYPIEHGKHVVFFSNSNKTDLWLKLDYYRSNPEEARRVAINGYLHAMKYHRTVNMIDFVFRSVHLKRSQQFKTSPSPYVYAAQTLLTDVKLQKKSITDNKWPGSYSPRTFESN